MSEEKMTNTAIKGKERTPIVTDGFKPPFRVGRKKGRAVVDSNGRELYTFHEGMEEMAQQFCDFMNGDYLPKSEVKELIKEAYKQGMTDENKLQTSLYSTEPLPNADDYLETLNL